MFSKINKIALLTCGALLAGSAVAATDSSLPNGKPFQYIQDQIVEISIAYTDLAERVLVMEQTIVSLQDENEFIESRIVNNKGDIEAQEEKIAGNTQLIGALQYEVSNLENYILLKQNLIDGKCEDSQAVAEINEDGSLVCRLVDVDGTISSDLAIKTNEYTVYMNLSEEYMDITCPDGLKAMSGGWVAKHRDVAVMTSKPVGDSTWRIGAREMVGTALSANNDGDVTGYVLCR